MSEAFRLNDIKFNRLIILLNFIFIFTLTLSLRYGRNLRIHLPTGYPRYIDVHGLSLGMRVNGLAGERGFENRQTCARDADNLNSRRAQHQVVNELVETEL